MPIMQMPNYPPIPVCAKTIFLAFTLHLFNMGTQKTVPINFYIICKIQPFQSLTFQACLCKCLTIPLPGCAKTIFLAFTLRVHRKLYRSIFSVHNLQNTAFSKSEPEGTSSQCSSQYSYSLCRLT